LRGSKVYCIALNYCIVSYGNFNLCFELQNRVNVELFWLDAAGGLRLDRCIAAVGGMTSVETV